MTAIWGVHFEVSLHKYFQALKDLRLKHDSLSITLGTKSLQQSFIGSQAQALSPEQQDSVTWYF